MKCRIFLLTLLCSISHSASAMFWHPPEHFANLKCPDPDKPINRQALLNENPFWKKVAKTARQEEKNNYLKEALLIQSYRFGGSSLWPRQRKAIACTLAAGASPDAASGSDSYATALQRAIELNDCALIKLALECKADPNGKTFGNRHLLYLAKTVEAATLLIEYKADIDCRNMGFTILHSIAFSNVYSPELITYYIQECGLNVNVLGDCNKSPLMGCAMVRRRDFNKDKFRLLLEHGADPTMTNAFGETVWDLARQNNCLEQAQEVYKQLQ